MNVNGKSKSSKGRGKRVEVVKWFILLIVMVAWVVWYMKIGFLPDYTRFFSPKDENHEPMFNPQYPGNIRIDKPVVYLYPTKPEDVQVKVRLDGQFITTYPSYNDGWKVTAYPDGKLINKSDGREYSYLYWEGDGARSYNMNEGFVVKGTDTANFLQEKLAYLGLEPREYNEFIVYWLPQMQGNQYNFVRFASKDEYDNKARLDITPKPDSIQRVFMVFKKLDAPMAVIPQVLVPFERKGFSVIEWGGSEIR